MSAAAIALPVGLAQDDLTGVPAATGIYSDLPTPGLCPLRFVAPTDPRLAQKATTEAASDFPTLRSAVRAFQGIAEPVIAAAAMAYSDMPPQVPRMEPALDNDQRSADAGTKG